MCRDSDLSLKYESGHVAFDMVDKYLRWPFVSHESWVYLYDDNVRDTCQYGSVQSGKKKRKTM
eukprot:scaffold213134_cov15-Tisochrysis_lutea.AAC.1